MKKFILPVVVGMLFSSCSRDNDGVSNGEVKKSEPVLLLSKIINVEENGDVETSTFKYDGDKLLEATSGYEKGWYSTSKFTYTGDLITHSTGKSVSANGEVSNEEVTYTYNSEGKLIKSVAIDIEDGKRKHTTTRTYTYNTNGEVVVQENEKTEYLSGPIPNSEETKKITYTVINDHVMKIVEKGKTRNLTTTYVYDDKNAPMQNIRGMRNLHIELFDGSFSSYKNNVISYKTIEEVGGMQETMNRENKLEYNDKGYPTKLSYKVDDNRQETYSFEYIEYKK